MYPTFAEILRSVADQMENAYNAAESKNKPGSSWRKTREILRKARAHAARPCPTPAMPRPGLDLSPTVAHQGGANSFRSDSCTSHHYDDQQKLMGRRSEIELRGSFVGESIVGGVRAGGSSPEKDTPPARSRAHCELRGSFVGGDPRTSARVAPEPVRSPERVCEEDEEDEDDEEHGVSFGN